MNGNTYIGKDRLKGADCFMKRLTFLCALLAVLLGNLLLSGYIFGMRDGFLGYCGDDGIWTVTDIPAQSVCRQEDRNRLTQGIYLDTKQALSKALEDFCS